MNNNYNDSYSSEEDFFTFTPFEKDWNWENDIFRNPLNENDINIDEDNSENEIIKIEERNEFTQQYQMGEIKRIKSYSKSNVSTEDQTENEKNQLFMVKKTGRKSKKMNQIKNNVNQKVHSKNNKDNLIRKIRIYLIKFTKDLLNNCIKIDFGKNTSRKIKGIIQELTSDITISFNIQFFNSSLERIFSNPLNKKYKNMLKNHNTIEIKKIREKKNEAPLTNELLDKNLIDIYNLFIQKGDYKYYYDRYGKDEKTLNLDELLNTFKKNGQDDKYIKNLKDEGLNLMKFFNKENARKVIKKRKIKFKGTNFEGFY